MARELLHPPRPMQDDETVGELVERHFGAEVVDRLADPLLSGVYGGDADKLSARAVLPRFVEMEEKYGSLSRAMLAAHNKMKAMAGKQPPRPLFSSLKDGMQQMVDAIVARLNHACAANEHSGARHLSGRRTVAGGDRPGQQRVVSTP